MAACIAPRWPAHLRNKWLRPSTGEPTVATIFHRSSWRMCRDLIVQRAVIAAYGALCRREISAALLAKSIVGGRRRASTIHRDGDPEGV